MNIKILTIGKTHKHFLIDGENEYQKRLKKYVNLTKLELPDIKNTKKMAESEIKIKEGDALLAKILPSDYVILLDDKGKMYSSVEFSKWLQKKMNLSIKTVVFIVGGAYGFSDQVYQRANEKISISKMTFSHQMIRMIFLEQVYRAFSILNNEPYHHE